MFILWIIFAVFLMFILSDYIWLILLLCGAAVVIYFVMKAKQDREEGERQWMIREEEKKQGNDLTHTYYYKTTPESAAADLARSDAAKDPLSNFTRYSLSAPHVHQGCPMVYRYADIRVSTVNRLKLAIMVERKLFTVNLFIDESGNIFLKSDNIIIAKLEEKVEMCRDWINKGLPLICEFSSFSAGFEKVALSFYKDIESKLSQDLCEIVRLNACLSPDKQETIQFLEQGEKLFVEYDDDNTPYLRDIEHKPIGKLPAKYNQQYDDGFVSGIFFDHSEIKEADDFESNDKHIPYVRIYIEK